MKLLETGLKLAEAQQLLPADSNFAFIAVKDGNDYTIGSVVKLHEHWHLAGEVGKMAARPGWDWKIGVFGKIGF